jgi:ABC-2 type transport system permease protein/oleandomycin transport system permease protein
MTAAAAPNTPVAERPAAGARLRHGMSDVLSIARRDLIRTARMPEMLTFAVIMGVFFLLIFNYVYGGAIGAGAGVDYIQFLVPGVLVITALTGSQQTGMGLAVDLSEGVVDRFRSLPMSQGAVIAGRTVADTARNVAGLLLVVALGIVLGFGFSTLSGALLAMLLVVGLGYAFSWLNGAIAARVRNVEMVSMLSMFWLFPLMLASSAFVPTGQMPDWLRWFADYQPVSVVSDAARALSVGAPAQGPVLGSVAWIVGITAVSAALALRAYRRPG